MKETAPQFTTGKVADLLSIPVRSLRNWLAFGHLAFERHETEVDSKEEADGPIEVSEGWKKAKWSRFSVLELKCIAIFAELAEVGVSLPVAARIIEAGRALLYGVETGRRPFLCIIQRGGLTAWTTGTEGQCRLTANWVYRREDGRMAWKAKWYGQDGNLAKPPDVSLPCNRLFLDLEHVIGDVDGALSVGTSLQAWRLQHPRLEA